MLRKNNKKKEFLWRLTLVSSWGHNTKLYKKRKTMMKIVDCMPTCWTLNSKIIQMKMVQTCFLVTQLTRRWENYSRVMVSKTVERKRRVSRNVEGVQISCSNITTQSKTKSINSTSHIWISKHWKSQWWQLHLCCHQSGQLRINIQK